MAEEKKGLILLDYWVSPFGASGSAAGSRWRRRACPTSTPSAKSELLLRSNPIHKKAPVLLHDGSSICESLVILNYLDSPPLLPADPYARAKARFWAAFCDDMFGVGRCVWKLRGEARDELVQALRNLDGELGEKPFFGGDAFGFVDVALVAFTPWLSSYERYGEFSVAEVAPRLVAWAARYLERESVAKSLYTAEKVNELLNQHKQDYDLE